MSADVCLFLEGTYPYVFGGVSSWVHRLISDLSDLKFSLVYLGTSPRAEREYKYEIPRNVVQIHEVFLRQGLPKPETTTRTTFCEEDWDLIRRFLEGLRRSDLSLFPQLVTEVLTPERMNLGDVFYGRGAWDFLERQYLDDARLPPFIDYFWLWRFSHLPILRLCSSDIPRARCYHALSTGYAGLMCSIARIRSGSPMVLTEHGIYTKERRIEINQADWVFHSEDQELDFEKKERYFKEMWIKLFLAMSRVSYNHADRILTLFEGNRQLQIRDGAEPSKIEIVPNGIDVERFASLYRDSAPAPGPCVALIGRVVPIKDIKTFLHAAKLVRDKRPDVTFHVLGPVDEDREYVDECLTLATILGLDEGLTFEGKVDLKEWMGRVDLQVLTSISEGQPLVLLEGLAAGVPFVATDVGACRELAEGRSSEDRALGEAGRITSIGSPERTAAAILEVLDNRDLYRSMAVAGRERSRRYYRSSQVSARYQQIYEELPYKIQMAEESD